MPVLYFLTLSAWVIGVCLLHSLPVLPPIGPFALAAIALIVAILAVASIPIRFQGRDRCTGDKFSVRSKWVLIPSLALLLGFISTDWRAGLRMADRLPLSLEGKILTVKGYIADLPQVNRFGTRFIFSPEYQAGITHRLPKRIQVQWYSASTPLHAGERWQLVIKPKRVHGLANPGGFDLESWFLQHHIGATATVRTGQRLPGFAQPASLARLREILRDRMLTKLSGAPYQGVIVALAIGDQSGIPPTQWLRFSQTGITHLVSISGLHVTLIASIVGYCTAWLWRRTDYLVTRVAAQRAALVMGVLAALVYSALAGMAVPTQRTFFMVLVAAICLWRGKASSVGTIWITVLAIVVMIDPFSVLSVGFWLSFLTVGALLWVGSGRIGKYTAWRLWISTQWAATLASIPILLVVFGQLSLVSPLANAFSIPIVSGMVTPTALLGLLDPTGTLLWMSERIFALVDWLLKQCLRLPGLFWSWPSPPFWTLLPAGLGVGLLLLPQGMPARWTGLIFLLPVFILHPSRLPQGVFRATILDVGQGLSVLVETRNSSLLFDTGPPSSEGVILPVLRNVHRTHLDTLILSHDDNDHTGGTQALLDQIKVEALIHRLPHPPSSISRSNLCLAGRQWEQDGVHFSLLWPPLGYIGKKDNAQSCVLHVSSGKQSLLIPSDIGSDEESRMKANLTSTTVVIAPHHGGRGSSSHAFIKALSPQYAIFSAGYRSRFGHPHPDIVARYAAAGAKTMRTDQMGAIIFESGPEPHIYGWRERRRHYWQSSE